eukprot:4580214-Ditylum_brightwellii.AAC.1
MVAVVMGQCYPSSACKGTRQMIIVFFVVWGGNVGCVLGWTQLTADNSDNGNNDDNAYVTKNGVNALFHCQPPSVLTMTI